MANEIRIGNGTLHLDRIAELLNTPVAKGLYGGAGLGALMALLKNNALDKKVSDIYADEKTDKDTMVLRIPRRTGDKRAAASTPKRDGSGTSTKELKKTSYRAAFKPGPAPRSVVKDHELADPRNVKKADVEKSALPRQFQEALHVLAVLGAGGVGYKAVTALHDKIVDKRLKADEEAARRAFMSSLMPKRASDEMEKEALSAGGTMALLMLLLGGGSAYVTRDILNARRDRLAGKSYDPPPPINRIVFKSEDADEDDEGTELTQDQFKAAFVIKLAEVSGVGADIITDDMLQYCPEFQKVAQATDQPGGRQQFYDWIKGTAGHIANAMPGLTNSLIMAGVKRWPQLLKMIPTPKKGIDPRTWVSPYTRYMAARNTGGQGFADRRIKSMLEGPEGDKYRSMAVGKGLDLVGRGVRNFGTNTMTGLKGLFMDPKEAAFPGLSASIAGSYLATKLDDNDDDAAAEQALVLPRKRARDTREIKRLIAGLEIEGKGPDAEAYVEENRARIKAAIRRLMEQEQI